MAFLLRNDTLGFIPSLEALRAEDLWGLPRRLQFLAMTASQRANSKFTQFETTKKRRCRSSAAWFMEIKPPG
jgi:hypothetical protein